MINDPKILWLFSAPLVASDDSPLDALDMKAERDAIVRELSTCRKAVSLRIGVATTDELARGVTEGFNILHVSCHGHEKFLLFEDGKGGSQPVTGSYLRRLIGMGSFILAIVSACHSEKIGAELIEAGIPHVVAIQSDVSVLDHSAIIFVGQFLRSLFQGESVQNAFKISELLVEGNPELMKMRHHLEFTAYMKKKPFVPEEKKFVLLPEGSAAHSNPLLSQKVPQGTLEITEPPQSESNLPVKPQSFTGRSVEMHEIICELFENRLVTITGAGGIGKTTLAVEVARWIAVRNYFPDEVYYLDLRQIDTADGILGLLGATVGAQFSDIKDVTTFLQERHCLILLDNAEDILWKDEDAAHDIIDSILKFTVNTNLLITSQRSVGGNLYEPEHVIRLLPLKQRYAALLFYTTTKRRMSRKECESTAFYTMLDHLGGHPLSIVLTARQVVPGMTLGDIHERIRLYRAKAIQVKSITDRDLEHGEGLVASLASAYDSLSDSAKILFQMLSMLPAGAREEMLTHIFGSITWEYVQELNDASLLEVTEHRRVTLLPPVRLYAASVCTDEIKEHYGPKIVEFLGKFAEELYDHHGEKNAKEYRFSFIVEEPNLRSAVDLPCAPPQTKKEPSALGLLGYFLVLLYTFHNRWNEAIDIGNKILTNLEALQDHIGEANTLWALGNVTMRAGSPGEARSRYEKALAISQAINEKVIEANIFRSLGDLAIRLGDLEEARTRYEEALDIYRDIGARMGEANTLWKLGSLVMWSGDLEEARTQYEEALDIYRGIGSKLGEANIFIRLGDLATWSGDLEEARTQYEKALRIYQYIGEEGSEAHSLIRLGQWAVFVNELEYAETILDNASMICREIEAPEEQANSQMVRALLNFKRQNIIKAKRELDFCSFIIEKISTYCEAVHWLTLYAAHLEQHDFKEGAKVCSEYAEKFASKIQDQHFLDLVKQSRGIE